MEVVMSKFFRKSRGKDGPQLSRLSVRKSLDASLERIGDVDDTEAHRKKAAAWAWHQRAGGDAAPTRESLENRAAVSRNSKVDRPKSRFGAEAMREIARDSSSKSKSGSETNLSDAAELSTLVKQIALCARTLLEESSSDKSFALRHGGFDKLNQCAFDPFSPSDGLSVSHRFHQRTSDQREFALSNRSSSDLSGPRQCHYAYDQFKTQRDCVDPEFREGEIDGFDQIDHFVDGGVPKHRKSSSRKSLFLFQRLFRKIYQGKDNLHSAISEQAYNHHHYHHHHHYYIHPHIPNEELQTLQHAKARRYSESFRAYTESDLADHETRRIRRHSGSNLAAK